MLEQPGNARHHEDSLAPVPRERYAFDEEVAHMRAGRGTLLVRWLSVLAASTVVAFFGLRAIEASDARDHARQGVHGLAEAKLDGFIACSLPDTRASQITSRDRLHAVIERHMDLDPTRYGELLRRCLPDLREFELGLGTLPIPGDVADLHRDMVTRSGVLYARVQALSEALIRDPSMDYVTRAGLIDRVTHAHADMEAARAAWNRAMTL